MGGWEKEERDEGRKKISNLKWRGWGYGRTSGKVKRYKDFMNECNEARLRACIACNRHKLLTRRSCDDLIWTMERIKHLRLWMEELRRKPHEVGQMTRGADSTEQKWSNDVQIDSRWLDGLPVHFIDYFVAGEGIAKIWLRWAIFDYR